MRKQNGGWRVIMTASNPVINYFFSARGASSARIINQNFQFGK